MVQKVAGGAGHVRSATRGGFTLLELTMVLGVFMVAFLALSQSLVTSMQLTDTNHETRLATDGAREMVEILEGVEDFDTIFRRYNDNPADDGGLVAPGSAFAVKGLEPIGLMAGEILFPTVGVELHEDVVDLGLGMPRDLDGDGDIDGADHSGDYRLLPVTLRVRWQGKNGERVHEIRTLLADR